MSGMFRPDVIAAAVDLASTGPARPLKVAQLGGCNLTQIIQLLPSVEIDLRIIRSSTASIAAPPLHVHAYKFSACPLKSRFMLGDFNKDFAQRLAGEPWDVLLIEFQRDIMTGFIKTCGTCVTEFTEAVDGETVDYGEIFETPYEVVDWRHPAFFETWALGARQLFEKLLAPMLDQGRRVVIVEICPALLAVDERGAFDQEERDGETVARRAMSRRMYDFAATLDPRIVTIAVEPEYHLSVFDSPHGQHYGHMISDFYVRAAAKILQALDAWTEDAQTELAHRSLQQHVSRYHEAAKRFVAAENDAARIASERDTAVEASTEIAARLRETEAALSLRLSELAHIDEQRRTLARRQEDVLAECGALEAMLRAAAAETAQQRAELARLGEAGRNLAEANAALAAAQNDERAAARQAERQAAAALGEAEAQIAGLAAARDRNADALARLENEKAALLDGFETERQAFAGEARALSERLKVLRDDQLAAEARAHEAQAARMAESAELERRLQLTVEAVEDLRAAGAALEADRTALRGRVEALLGSSSWRLTAPLRALKTAWLRLGGAV